MAVKKQFTSFEEMVSQSPIPVLVDFYATWCGPCQMMAKVLEQVGPGLRDRLQIVKIDSDRYPQLASQYGVQALPTLILFKGGRVVDRLEGVPQTLALLTFLEPHLPKSGG